MAIAVFIIVGVIFVIGFILNNSDKGNPAPSINANSKRLLSDYDLLDTSEDLVYDLVGMQYRHSVKTGNFYGELELEPENIYDNLAIAVYNHIGLPFGYIPKNSNGPLFRTMVELNLNKLPVWGYISESSSNYYGNVIVPINTYSTDKTKIENIQKLISYDTSFEENLNDLSFDDFVLLCYRINLYLELREEYSQDLRVIRLSYVIPVDAIESYIAQLNEESLTACKEQIEGYKFLMDYYKSLKGNALF